MDIEILEDLGLRESEIKVYLALLKIGESSAGKIIEKTNLHNSVVHRSLNSLIENGLVSYILEGKHKVYTSTDPTNFLNFIDDKKKRFLEILPKLQEEQRKQNETNTATLFKGKKGN
jgi:sugar-specific transcriptional regulator TrmB